MKKKLLILAMCLMSAMSAQAATWVALESGNPNIQMFIDNDSIKYLSHDRCVYSILYKKFDKPVKLAYIKSDYSTNKIGIIRVEDYEIDKYDPVFYAKHSRAFMKDAEKNKILLPAHNYALTQQYRQSSSAYTQNMNTGYNTDYNQQQPQNTATVNQSSNYSSAYNTGNTYSYSNYTESPAFNAYARKVKDKILSNWNTTISTIYTDINIVLSINMDGSLNGYRILNSSGGEKAKRAALAAIMLSAPFSPFPDGNMLTSTVINIPLHFQQKFFKNYVK